MVRLLTVWLSKFWRQVVDWCPPEVRTRSHPQLGELSFSDGLWNGHLVTPQNLDFSVAGRDDGPDPQLVIQLLEVLDRWSDVHATMMQFMGTQLPPVPGKDVSQFHVDGLVFYRGRAKQRFMVYLSLEADAYGLWRVEFIDGEPKYLGRDS